MKKLLIKLLLSLLLFQTLTIASVESDFYRIVHKVCKAYRVGTGAENMALNYIDKNKLSFIITLDSRRNNYDMVLMVGFIASGKAIDEVFYNNDSIKESWKEIDVTVQVPLTRTGIVVKAKADASFVVQFSRGEISTLEFTNKVIINKY